MCRIGGEKDSKDIGGCGRGAKSLQLSKVGKKDLNTKPKKLPEIALPVGTEKRGRGGGRKNLKSLCGRIQVDGDKRLKFCVRRRKLEEERPMRLTKKSGVVTGAIIGAKLPSCSSTWSGEGGGGKFQIPFLKSRNGVSSTEKAVKSGGVSLKPGSRRQEVSKFICELGRGSAPILIHWWSTVVKTRGHVMADHGEMPGLNNLNQGVTTVT